MKRYVPVGCTLEEIEKLQLTNKVRLPKAYIEFLFLAGRSHRLFSSGIDSEFEILEEIQESFLIELKESNLKIERPIWAIDMLHGEQFAFFYLDEKSENPKVYRYMNNWEEEPVSFDFNDVIFSTEQSISKYFDSMVPSRWEKIIPTIIFRIVDFFTFKFLTNKS